MDSIRAGALLAIGLAWLVGAPSATAAPPDKDAFASSGERARLGASDRAALRAAARPGTDVQLEQRLGVPTTLWAADPHPTFGTPADAARRHLKRLAGLYDLSGADVDAARVESVHDTGRGALVVTLRQYVHGVPVFREKASVMMSRDLGLVGIGGYLSPSDAGTASFPLGEREAIALAAGDLLGTNVRPTELRSAGRKGAYELFTGDLLAEPARAERVMYRLPERLESAYYVEVHSSRPDEYFGYVVSAGDGRILYREDLVDDADFSYRVWADSAAPNLPLDGPQGNAGSPHPTGLLDTFEPSFATPSLVTLPHGPISTNDPWLPDAATETVGNNADAYADIAAPDGLTAATADMRASLTGANTFDHTYDTTAAPLANTTQTQAAITQAFYTVNFLHDWFYDSGFDEVSGNAQQNNYGRGGSAGDAIKVEVQDGGGVNNANMSTPADGAQPRMQMFPWLGAKEGSLTINSPAGIAGDYTVGLPVFGPASFQTSGTVAIANPANGCTAITGVIGVIAVIDRGTCSFKTKVKNAQDAGAAGALIVNNVAGGAPALGDDATIATVITIPSLGLSQSDGNAIKAALAGDAVSVTLRAGKTLDRDGALDNEIVAHEWGHYISHRLVGSLSTQMAGGLGEGWGDFTALLLTVRAEDAATDFAGVYPTGPYALRTLSQTAYYFGIRRVPYSTDFNKNALTFKHITDGQPLPAVPTQANGAENSEVHNTGEIWATMLWEAYAGLLRDTEGLTPRLTFDQAQQRMRDYLVAAYKMTPADPTLLEARDALLMAAGANDAQDAVRFWQAFAVRGAGAGAVGPDRSSTSNSPVTESFSTSGHIKFVSAALEDDELSCDGADGLLDNGERGRLRVTVRNDGAAALDSTTATISTSNPNVTIDDTTLEFPDIAPFESAEASTVVSLDGAGEVQTLDFDISIEDPGVVPAGPVTAQHFSVGAGRIAVDNSASDDMLSPVSSWSTSGTPKAEWTRQLSPNPLDGFWHGPDLGQIADASLVSPALQAGSDPVTFSLRHRFSFETSPGQAFDGGVIEVSTDGGTTWADITTVATGSVGYSATIESGGGNPLSARQAYGKVSAAYPGLVTQAIDLGTALAGQTFRIRFRLGSDASVGAPGWDIDEVSFTGLTNTPFDRLVADPGCPEPVTAPPETGGGSGAGGQTASGGGEGAGTGQPAGGEPTGGQPDAAPEISAVKLAGVRFRAATKGAAITASPIGTRVTFSLSEAATVTVRVERQTVGRQAGGRCRAVTRSNRKAKRCVRFVQVRGSASVVGDAGSNSFRFTGRWPRKPLGLGAYRLRLSAADAAGHVSAAKSSPVFRIVRR